MLLGVLVCSRERNPKIFLDGNSKFECIDRIKPKTLFALAKKRSVINDIGSCHIFEFKRRDNHFLDTSF